MVKKQDASKNNDDDSSAIIEVVFKHFKSIPPRDLVSVSESLICRSGFNETLNVNINDGLTRLGKAILSLLCPVCLGEGKLGHRDKIECPRCNGSGWVI